MRSNEFKNLLETAFSISNPQFAKAENLQESYAQNLYEGVSNEEIALVESISEVLDGVESQLGIQMSQEEISEATNFILEIAAQDMIVEAVQNDVGFELNEEEIHYVLNQLRG